MSYVKSTEVDQGAEFVVRCAFPNCKCRIIPSSSLPTDLTTIQNTPHMLRLSKPVDTNASKNEGKKFYKVTDVWHFDNIAVSKKIPDQTEEVTIEGDVIVDVQRLLVCSDCDKGPIGFAGFLKGKGEEQKVEDLVYFLHSDSVLYEVK